MHLVLTGYAQIHNTRFARIDNVEDADRYQTVEEALEHPFALVLKEYDAKFLINAVNAYTMAPDA